MVLEREREPVRVRGVWRTPHVGSGASELHVVVHQNAIVKHCHAGSLHEASLIVEARTMEDDVICLPLSRRPARIH